MDEEYLNLSFHKRNVSERSQRTPLPAANKSSLRPHPKRMTQVVHYVEIVVKSIQFMEH